MLMVVDQAIGRYLAQRSAPPSELLTALVPMSLREAGDEEAGNNVSGIVVRRAYPGAGAALAMCQIVCHSRSAKDEIRSMSALAATQYAALALLAAPDIGRLGVKRPLASLPVFNVPGPAQLPFLAGATLMGLFPVSVVNLRMALNVTLVSPTPASSASASHSPARCGAGSAADCRDVP